MKLNVRTRRLLLAAALSATLLAVIYAPPEKGTVQPVADAGMTVRQDAKPDSSAPPQAASSHASPGHGFRPQKRTALQNEPGDLFLVDRPPPAATASGRPAPPPIPTAPPLPYAYMGRMRENDELVVFLTRQDKPYVVHAGDVLDGQYRVESIRPPLIEFTYIPFGQKQMLNIGAIK